MTRLTGLSKNVRKILDTTFVAFERFAVSLWRWLSPRRRIPVGSPSIRHMIAELQHLRLHQLPIIAHTHPNCLLMRPRLKNDMVVIL